MNQVFKLFAVILLFSVAEMGLAQVKSKKVDIEWGEELRQSKKLSFQDVVGYDNTGIYVLKERKAGFYGLSSFAVIERFDNEMNYKKSYILELEHDNKKRDYEFIVQMGESLILFSSFKDQKRKRNVLYGQRINKRSLQPQRKPVKIGSIDYSGHSKSNSGTFDYSLSRDSSKLLIYYNVPQDNQEKEQFGFHVLDNEMNEIWDKKVTLPYKSKLFDVERYRVDNHGDVYLLGRLYMEKRREKRAGKPNYKYELLGYSDLGETRKKYAVDLKGMFLTDMQIDIDDNRDIICAGFYSDEGTYSIRGSYFLKIDRESKEIVSKSSKDFGLDFITQTMREGEEKRTVKRAEKGKDVELYEYDLDKMIIRDDGGVFLVGEQFYVKRTESYGSPFINRNSISQVTYTYYYNDIIAVNIDPNGEIIWTEKVPKKQKTLDDEGYYSSYVAAENDGKLYFVFNDNPKNLFYRKGDRIHNFRKNKESLVVLVELQKNGDQSREALFSAREAEMIMRPKVCEQISDEKIILFGQKRAKQRFIELTLVE